MKKLLSLLILLSIAGLSSYAQTAYNPFTQNIHFAPEPTVFGFECGTVQTVSFTQGITTSADATQWQSNPLTVTICLGGFTFNGTNASSVVSGSYASNFDWAFVVGSSNCIIGTQNQTLKGAGGNPLFPDPLSTGPINLSLKVPDSSPVGTVLSVNVSLQVPSYMSLFNDPTDDTEATQTQTFCNCYALTNGGTVGTDQSFCVSGNPVLFSNLVSPTGGSGGTIEYQWQSLVGTTWTNISGATTSTYDAPVVTATTLYRRNAKRSICGNWVNSNEITVTINPNPTANAGVDKNLNCTTTSATIGTAAIAGNSYSWSPSAGLSSTIIAQPTAFPNTNTSYTVTVTNANGCTASDVVVVNVNTTLPTVDAGVDKNLNCTTTSTTIGTTAVVGNTYSWSPSVGLSSNTIAQPTASPNVTTTYTVTATGSNGCTATDVVVVNVNTSLPTVNAGPDKNLNCTTTSATIGTTAVVGNTYSWSPAAGLSSTTIAQPIASPSANTVYTVTVTGSNGCTATDIVNVNVNTTLPTANAGPDKNLDCTTTSSTIGTTSIAGNTYSWSPATGLSSTTIAQPIASPSVTSTYTVTVTGSNGCTATDIVNVNVNTTLPTADAGLDKNLNCTTTSTTIGTTAVVGNTYSWSPSTALSSTTIAQPTASPNVTTTYTVTVTGSNGCTATDVVVVNVNTTLPTVNAGPDKNLNCTTTSATIGTTAVVGNTYSWSPAAGLSSTTIAQPIASPSANTVYTVTVTGSNGCTATDIVNVNVNTTLPTANAGPDKSLDCTTTSSTIGTTSIAGNTYSWSPATGLSSTTIAQPIASPSVTSTYTVTVTGSNGCTATDVVVVNVNTTLPTADAGLDKNLNCTTTSTTIGTTAVVGNTYSWSPSTALSSTTIAQPTASPNVTTTYTVTATGSNGCTATDVVVVNVNTTLPTVNAGPDKNLNCTTTSATIGTTAVVGNTYSWSPAAGLSSTTIAQPIASPSANTVYTVTVTGSNGCTATDIVNVNVNTTLPTANAGPDKSLDCTTTSSTIGTTSIAGNTYSWSPATGLSSTTIAQPIASPSVTSTYTVTVTGSNGCTASDVVVVNVNTSLPTVDAGVDKNLNCTTTSTTIGTTAVVGNTYSWSPSTALSSTTIAQPTASPNVTTTYTVTATGSNGCTATDVVVVNVNTTLPTVNAGPDKNLNCTTTSATIGTTAVVGNTYSWSPAAGLSSTTIAQPIASPSTNTVYTVTVTGSNGCTATDIVNVNVNTTLPTANAGPDKNLDCTTTSTTIGTTSLAGNTYSWSPSVGLSSTTIAQPIANPSVSSTYTVTVTGSNGCTASDVVVVNVNTSLPTVDAGVDKNLNCTTTSTTIGTSALAGTTYSWSPSVGLSSTTIAQPIASPNVTTTYTVTATGSNGCTATDVVVVNVNTSLPTVDAGPDKTVCSNTSVMIGTAGVLGNSYSWTPSTGLSSTTIAQPIANPLVSTSYMVTVTGANGCTATDVVVVNFKEGSVGNYVWMDINGDGLNNEAASNGINGLQVELWKTTDLIQGNNDDQMVQTTVTANNLGNPGYYNFKICDDGDYYVKFPLSSGGNDKITLQTSTAGIDLNSDANVNAGISPIFNINTSSTGIAKDNPTIDAGYVPLISLGNLVWKDVNRNGVRDNGEVGIREATVNLYLDANGDGLPDGPFINSVQTDLNGLYVFNGLYPGKYIIGVVPPIVIGGGSYTSSITGQELNPNNDVDNNDNGITTISGETRSGTINLNANSEPLGETPNNAALGVADANTNLTVDFGFFLCPANFTFTPQYVCPGTTFDLTSIEPANYTGGVWTLNGNAVTSTSVTTGTYVYTFTDGDCIATGTVTLSTQVPDYKPTITITPNAITGISTVRAIIKIEELLNRNSCTPIYVLVPRLAPRYTFTYEPTATSILGAAVNNADWQYFDSNPNFYIWKYVGNATFPAGGVSRFGYAGPYDPTNTDGETTFTVQIFQGSGGETNQTNNTDADVLIYFR